MNPRAHDRPWEGDFRLPGSNRRADIADTTSTHPNDEDFFQLSVEGGSFSSDGTSQQRQFLDMVVFFGHETLSTSSLETRFSTTDITPVSGAVAFRINDFELDPTTNELLSQRYVAFDISLTGISAAPVPEPGTGLLLAAGLTLLGGRRHGRA